MLPTVLNLFFTPAVRSIRKGFPRPSFFLSQAMPVSAGWAIAGLKSVPTEDLMRALVPGSDSVGAVRERRAEGRSLFQRQLRVIGEMLEDMEPQTVAGQRHTMEKVVAFLRSHVGPGAISVTLRNGLELSQLVEQLERETRRRIPDVRLFSDRAEALVLLLSATA